MTTRLVIPDEVIDPVQQQIAFPAPPPSGGSAALVYGEDETDTTLDLGFMAKCFVGTTLPHSKPKEAEFTRRSAIYTLSLTAPKEIGVPYGRYPRLMLAWMTREALRSTSSDLAIGRSFSAWAIGLGVNPTCGAKGTLAPLRMQLHRLLSTSVAISWERELRRNAPQRVGSTGFRIGLSHDIDETKDALWIRLSSEFFNQLRDRPVPIDLNVLRGLRGPFEMDVYLWLTLRSMRTQRIQRPEQIPWKVLRNMFGCEYSDERTFKFNFLAALKKVFKFYPKIRVEPGDGGLILKPYPPHVPTRISKIRPDPLLPEARMPPAE